MNQFTKAYIECALRSSTEYQFGECPCCGNKTRLDHYPEKEFEQVPMCGAEGCGVTEIPNPEPMDSNYSVSDIHPDTLKRMMDDCRDFQADNEQALTESELSDEQAGHDFWLNRNGHGAGFWDRGLGRVGETLSAASRACGSFDLYVGDDGMIHGS